LALVILVVGSAGILLFGCAGGGGSANSSGPPSFSVGGILSTITISSNSTTQIQLTLNPQNGFSGTVTVNLSGLPSGVTSSPASPFTVPAAGLVLNLTASSTVSTGTYPLTFQETSGNLTFNQSASLNVQVLATFSLHLFFSDLLVRQNGSVSGTFDITNGSSGSTNFSVNLSVAGLPAGVTATFSENPLPGIASQQSIMLNAASGAALGTNIPAQLIATRVSDGVVASASFTITDALPPGQLPGNRTTLIRTGDTPSSAVYDALHKMAFASEPNLGLVDAISVPAGQIVTRIPVPGVQALGISADNTQILATTSTQQVAWIDTRLMEVSKWQLLPLAGDPVLGMLSWIPYNFQCVVPDFASGGDLPSYVQNPYLLSNGKVLFEATESGVFPAVVEWDPVANTATIRKDLPGGNGVAANPSGTEVLFAGNPSIYVAATDSVQNSSGLGAAFFAAANPAGNQFALGLVLGEFPDVVFVDDKLNVLGRVILNQQNEYQPTGVVYSLDGTRLYVVTPGPVGTIITIDTTTFSILGTAPGYANGDPRDAFNIENPLTADDTGLVIGSAVGGLVFDDSTDFYNFTATEATQGSSVTPSEGPVQGGTLTKLSPISTAVPDVWFGAQRATATSMIAPSQLQATTPPAQAVGVVNVKLIDPTGVMAIVPQGFTFGTVPLLTAPLAEGPAGNVIANVFGFGFSADAGVTSQQATIGGRSASVVAATQSQGFPVQGLVLNVPPGSPGPADIVVTSPTGTATYPKGFRYLNSVTTFSSPDTFSAVLYDSVRRQLYLNAGDHIDVFSLISNSFGTPIKPPTLGATSQLQGMALTPDSSKLIVGNFSDDSVSIINPDLPAGAMVVQIAPPIGPDAQPEGPHSIATTSKNTAFIDIGTTGFLSGGGGLMYELDLTTLHATVRNDVPNFVQVSGEPMSQSADGTRVFLCTPDDSGGSIAVWSAETDSWKGSNLGGVAEQFLDDVATARDGNLFAVNNADSIFLSSYFFTPMFVDSNLNLISQLGIESLFSAGNEPGIALHDSGALLYSSTYAGVDIIDVRHGSLAERILLSQSPALLSGSLSVDNTGQQIFLITSGGLAVIQLDAVPLSIGSLSAVAGQAGTVIKLRGSGFQSGTTATVGGVSALSSFIDADTMEITVPAVPSGTAAVTLTNPDGTSYRFDAAFAVQ